ncbi:sigma-54-dependent Fis family transcriptional regulator [Marinobacterium nitratireducens]|uniref:Sigma-54-dependent Fis family transcriptional regulator n=1 Tax=Marinobacterium nitratireducens TaxID=518897 RepID=A0A918DXW5_9GAMM|nr:sigma-54-dependent Fis family transcriptional regulator [Marinobacterium nitratireducens]GGO87211.1 sigma-54-dependent Fis family transcriptional regulator [Marinobacterium nitratireducens]
MKPKRDTGLKAEFLAHLRQRNARLKVHSQRQFTEGGRPSADDLAASFRIGDAGNDIWLAGQQVMLMQADVFGTIRRELVDRLGMDATRRFLKQMGWQAGARDAAQVTALWPDGDDVSLFSAGPRLHKLKGVIDIEVVQFEIDNARGRFYGEFLWYDSMEAMQHLASYGVSSEGVCWMQLGYASGYASTLLGRDVVFHEVECRGCGQEHCRIIGKPAEEWGATDDDMFAETEVALYTEPRGATASHRHMVGGSPAFLAATRLLSRVAPTNATVLLTGESGVGKELFARALHRQSGRAEQPLIALNCATLPENLVEAELFGVEKGAFTGADRQRRGRFERASGGTLFLDEIATLSLSAQGKILRVIQEGELERIGGSKTLRVDVRIVAATNLNLRSEVVAGRFREDLFYRLNVFPIHLPPLRERREDLPLLMSHFLQHYCRQYERRLTGFTTRLVNTLLSYPFPGNIRELQNLIERGVIVAEDGEALDINHLALGGENERLSWRDPVADDAFAPASATPAPAPVAAGAGSPRGQQDVAMPESWEVGEYAPLARLSAFLCGDNDSLETSLSDIESLLIDEAMARSDGNVTAAARMLGMSRAQLSYRLKDRPVGH